MDYREPIEESDLRSAESMEYIKSKESSLESPTLQQERSPESRVEGSVESSQAESDATYAQLLAKVKSVVPSHNSQADIAQDASEVHRGIDRETQLSQLVDIALIKGVEHAVSTAEHLHDYYLLDQLHDTLVHDDLHDKLVERGLITSE